MAIEIIPKPKIKKRPPVNVFFYILLVLFLAFLVSYFVLYFSQKKLNQELSDIEKSLETSAEEKALEQELLGEQKKINDFGSLISGHQFTANLFARLEESTHPKVHYSKFKLDSEKEILELSGQAENFETLGQQLLIFKEKDFIKNINIKEASISKEGKIDFEFQIDLDPKIFTPLK